MSVDNRHSIEVQGDTFKEMADKALEIFDAYFGRDEDLAWDVTQIEAGTRTVLRDGAGQPIKIIWEARFTAEIRSVSIGTQTLVHAMRFA